MPSSNACWGIEIGSGAIKALKLVRDGDALRVADFVVLPHKKVLSTPELDQDEALRIALGALTSQYDLSKASIAISSPGHAGFTRFAKLPPVEPKKISGIVKYEAVQQIPFPLEEVEWDYQTFANSDSPDVEVGIFAMTRERVMQRLNLCADVNLRPDVLNLSPISVYNAMAYDLEFTESTEGVVIVDIGASATDLIVADAGRVWVRTFPIGGHNFTEAIVSSFKLPYTKAEKLKREAEQSKHKRHIFQAMRPVFTDLAQDVQRSIAYYQQLHPDTEIKKVIGLGSTFRLIGLRKYLSQQLQIDVSRCESFRRIQVEGPAESDFQSATLGMATAYGLAIQGLGEAAIDANLVPVPVIRESIWKRKAPVFATAAAIALAAGAASFIRPMLDSRRVDEARSAAEVAQIQQVKREGRQLRDQWQEVTQSAQIGHRAENILRLFERKDLYARIIEDVSSMIATAPVSETPDGFALRDLRIQYVTPSGGSPQWITFDADQSRTGRTQQRGGGGSSMMGGPAMTGRDQTPARTGRRGAPDQQADATGPHGAMALTLTVESTNPELTAFVDRTLLRWLRDNAEREDAQYTIMPPSADDVVIQQITDSDRGRGGSTPTRGGAGRMQDLESLAPLSQTLTPPGRSGPAYRYVITWRIVLDAPPPVVETAQPAERRADARGDVR